MSVLSSRVGIVACSGAGGKTPVDELNAKWTVAAAVFFVALEIAYVALAGMPPSPQRAAAGASGRKINRGNRPRIGNSCLAGR